jgi:hypothetical protein
MARPRLYRAAARGARLAWPLLARFASRSPALAQRAFPEHPGESFRERWRRTRGSRT